MQIKQLTVENFRSIEHVQIDFEPTLALIGSNNSGKSTILKSLELFFEAAPKISADDFYNRQADTISIIIEFFNLTTEELEEFGNAVVNNTLTVKRTLSLNSDINLHYQTLAKSYPAFSEIREETNKTQKRTKYNTLCSEIEGLEVARNDEGVTQGMENWEENNPDQLKLAFIRGFFGAPNIANGKLKKKTSLSLVPAVADAASAVEEGRKSPIIQLLSDISRQIFENKNEIKEFIEKSNEDFSNLTDPSNFSELSGISETLTTTLQTYYKDSKLLANWHASDEINFNFPKPSVKIENRGFVSGLENVGHGLQRAALFSIILFLATRSSTVDGEDFSEPQSDIIVLIEEPEIYQHPHKQSLILDALHRLTDGFSRNTGIRFQVVFTTHSEKFVTMHKFQSNRILRRVRDDERYIHSVRGITVKECSKYFADFLGVEPMSDEAFVSKMHIFSREICEGFFSEKVILVEGVSDKAVLEGCYLSKSRNPLSEGICIIPVEGKTKMDKPLYIFDKLSIPVFAVFDSDLNKGANKKKPAANRIIQHVCGSSQILDFPDGLNGNYFAFSCDLESYLRSVAGEIFEAEFERVSSDYGLDLSDLFKTPYAISRVVEGCRNRGATFSNLDAIIDAVDRI